MTSGNCFLGCSLPDEATSWLCTWQRHLRGRLAKAGLEQAVGWVRPESLHLTLLFLGRVPDRECQRLQNLLVGRFIGLSAPDTVIQPPRFFPKPARPRGLWCPVIESGDRLQQLHAALLPAGDEVGLSSDAKPFRPHITLGRVRRRFQGGRELKKAQLIPVQAPFQPSERTAELWQVHLYRTEATPQGNLYRRLATWIL